MMVNRKSISIFHGLVLGSCMMGGLVAHEVVTLKHHEVQAQESGAVSADAKKAHTLSMKVWYDLPSEFVIRLNQQLPPHERLAWMIDADVDTAQWPGLVMNIDGLTVEEAVKAYTEKAGLSYRLKGRLLWIGQASELKAKESSIQQWLKDLGSGNAAKVKAAEAGILSLWQVPAGVGQKARFFTFLGHPDTRKRRHAPMAEYGSRLPAPWVILQQLAQDDDTKQAIQTYMKASPSLTRDPLAMMIGSLIQAPEMISAAKEWNSKDTARARIQGSWREWERNSMFRNYLPQWVARMESQELKVSAEQYAARVDAAREAITKMNPGKGTTDRQLRTVLRQIQNGYGRSWGQESLLALGDTAKSAPKTNMRELALAILGLRQGADVQAIIEDRLSHDEAPSVRRAAAMALGELRTESGTGRLKKELFENESPIMRRNAAYALAKSRYPESATWLIERMKQAEGTEAQALVQVMALTRDDRSRDYLIELLKDGEADLALRQSAAIALTLDRSKPSAQALVEVLKSEAPRVLRERTIKGLRPRNMQELNRNLPIMLSVLESEKDAALQIELLLGIQQIARLIQKGDPRKVEIADRVLPIALDQSLNSNLRIKALETFKHTENRPEVIEALKKLEANETARVMKSFARIAAQQAAANPAPIQ